MSLLPPAEPGSGCDWPEHRSARSTPPRFCTVRIAQTWHVSTDAHTAPHVRVLRAALESTPNGVMVVDPDGRMVLHNRRFEDLWGHDADLLASGDDTALLEAASQRMVDPEAFLARVHELYADRHGETTDDLEFLDGRILERQAAPVLDDVGAYIGHMWTFRDVTAQRREQQRRLRQSSMRIELLERLDVAAQALDRAITPTDVLIAILREGLETLGADAGYVGIVSDDEQSLDVRRLDVETGHVEYLGEVPADAPLPIAESARTGASLIIEDNHQLQCEHPTLTRILADDHACATLPLRAQGRVRAVLNIGYDEPRQFDDRDRDLFLLLADRAALALERAMLKEELERRASASYALEHISDAVILLDARDLVQLWNPAATLVTGISESEAVGNPMHELVANWSELDRASRDLAVEPTPGLELVRIDGRRVGITIRSTRGPSGHVLAIRDVTSEQRLERAKSDFIATVSHELRTPITSIMGGAMTLQRADLELDESTRALLLQTIIDESRRLADIAGQVLLAAKLDAGKPSVATPVPELVDVRSIIAAATDAAASRQERDLEVSQPDGPLLVRADGGQLRQVVDNLLENARRYSPADRSISLRTGLDGDDVFIAVLDQGIGIAAEDQQHIFRKFVRLDASMSRGVGGAGLGLYIAHEFVGMMGGTVEVESPGINRGTTFTVRIPAHQEHRNAPGSAAP